MRTRLVIDDAPETAAQRAELVSICEAAIVPMDHWHDRDSAQAHEGVGRAWAMLRAGAPFHVITEGDLCVTDDETIWVEIEWEDFNRFEWGDDVDRKSETFYLPTRARLERTLGHDWY